ncbi:MAG TPA: alkaline phosphatase family protein [Flavobacteriales bacterium]|nr:alkaline phosphatase family protein [Flavobacteriales bacterium]
MNNRLVNQLAYTTALVFTLVSLAGCAPTYTTISYLADTTSVCCEKPIPELISGPMIGHVSMRSAQVWAQVDNAADLSVSYWKEGDEESAGSSDWKWADSKTAFSAQFELSGLDPGSSYSAVLVANGEAIGDTINIDTQVLWDYRMDPPEFKAVIGSCTFINDSIYDRPGRGYGGEYEVFESIVAAEPDMMLWLGDNVYMREVDVQSYSGYLYRYTHTRAVSEMQDLLKACPNYAIWDDHDFGPNDADASWVHRDWAQDAFKTFWANPSYGAPSGANNIATAFRFSDVEFFLLDNRSQRIHHNNRTQDIHVLGDEQIDWLIAALNKSKAPFKMVAVGGEFLNTAELHENMANFPERQEIIDRIEEEHIHGVVFLTGDRHCTDMSRIELEGGAVIHDLTVSPLTSSAYDNSDEPNDLRIEGTTVPFRNFAELNFSGPRKNRSLEIVVKDVNGVEVWTEILIAKEL